MSALLLGLWARAQAWVLGAAAVLAAIAGVYLSGKRQARRDAALEGANEALRRREVRDAVDRDVAGVPDAAGRLRDKWTRD